MNHLEKNHDIFLETEEKNFDSYEEFSTWKEAEEETLVCQFYKQRSTKNKKSTVIDFICCRSGCHERKSKGIRRMRLQGSKKLNAFCPANIQLTLSESGCLCLYTKTHLGHTNGNEDDLAYVSLPKSHRQEIASKIALGVPFQRIQEDISELSANANKSECQKLFLINNQDLRNISAAHYLKSTETVENDVENVETFVLENKDCVLYYKKQGQIDTQYKNLTQDDILIVIMSPLQKESILKFGTNNVVGMDGTHGLNAYGFMLHTLLVIDEYSEGVPACFAVTNRNDEQVISVFLTIIKQEIGILPINTLITDMQETYFNSWTTVMGKPNNYLYCTWHVREAWRRNLKKINNTDLRQKFYKQLLDAASETDEIEFQRKIELLINENDNMKDYKDYVQYLKSNYMNQVQRWAYCYRVFSGVNTNMYVESFHKTLKYWFGDRKKIKPLSSGLKLIKKYLLRLNRSRKRKVINGKLSFKLKTIRRRHDDCVNQMKKNSNIIVQPRNSNSWLISSFNEVKEDMVEMYIVTKIRSKCHNCPLICEKCETCFHEYQCTCVDASIKNNMCKHIHCLKMNGENEVTETESEPSLQLRPVPFEMNVNPPPESSPSGMGINKKIRNIEEEKQNVLSNFKEILEIVQNESELMLLKNSIQSIKPKILGHRSVECHRFMAQENVSETSSKARVITKQKRFFSTRKMKKIA